MASMWPPRWRSGAPSQRLDPRLGARDGARSVTHAAARPVIPRRQPLHALGYVLNEDGVRPLARTLRRLRQRGRRYVFEEGMARARMARSLAATNGLFLP